MRRTLLLTSVLPFISAFLGGILAFSLVIPSAATAQSGQAQEVWASAFTLVGPDGTVLARLEPGAGNNGRLQLFDSTGALRVGLAGQGALNVYDTDGTTQRFRVGYVPFVDAMGRPPINGVWLDPEGSISVLPPAP